MIRQDTTLVVAENSDPLKRIQLWVVSNSGVKTPFDLTAVDEIEFIGKTGQSVADSAAFAHYRLTVPPEIVIEGPAVNGVVAVQFQAAHLTTPGVFRWHLDVVKVGRRTPVAAGPLIVQNL